nr:hypothetical protein [uncultured Chryseobacterium sp.]
MNYSSEQKPAKILNLRSLKELENSLDLIRNSDTDYFSRKRPENNYDRVIFSLSTSDVNIQPCIRQVICINKGKRYNDYQSFVIEPKTKSMGIVVIMIKVEEQQSLFCNVRILPFSSLSDIAEPESDSQLLTVNLEKSKCILKTDITIVTSNTGEALYAVHNVDVNAVSNLITRDEIVELKRELEFQGSKLMAHYFQEVLDIIINENSTSQGKLPLIQDEYSLNIPDYQSKEMISANAISGCLMLEITGNYVINDLNRDWKAAGAFIGYLL